MSKKPEGFGIWPDKGALSDRNPRYLHAKLLSGSGYTPEPVDPPAGWFETHGPNVYPIELVGGDDWDLLEQSEDLSPGSRIQIAIEAVRGLQHIRDAKGAILWDIKPEHIMIQSFRSPDDVSQISVKFIDLETLFMVDRDEFSTLGEPTKFTLNSIARQQSILLQGGIFDPEAEVVESLIDYIRTYAAASGTPSPIVTEALDYYWSTVFNCNFDNFLDCLQNILDHIVS